MLERDGYVISHDNGQVDMLCSKCYASVDRSILAEASVSMIHDEADAPEHCDWCHILLDVWLTTDGVNYVIDRLRQALKDGLDYHAIGSILPWYEGLPRYSVLVDWADKVALYGLEASQQDVLSDFRDEVKRVEKTMRYKLYWSWRQIVSQVIG